MGAKIRLPETAFRLMFSGSLRFKALYNAFISLKRCAAVIPARAASIRQFLAERFMA